MPENEKQAPTRVPLVIDRGDLSFDYDRLAEVTDENLRSWMENVATEDILYGVIRFTVSAHVAEWVDGEPIIEIDRIIPEQPAQETGLCHHNIPLDQPCEKCSPPATANRPAQPAVQNLAEELRGRILAPQPNGWDATTQVWAEASKMAFNQAADALDNLLPPEVWERKVARQAKRKQKLELLRDVTPKSLWETKEELVELGIQIADEDQEIARLCPTHLREQGGEQGND